MGLHSPRYKGLLGWVDRRMPSIMDIFETQVANYYAPKNFNFWYFFGSLAAVVLVIQLVSGAFLAMHYKPDSRMAFWSVELIMREVQGGWLIRYMHSVGASFFFIVIYFHIFRAMLYGSYRTPREMVWIAGCILFLALMAESFFGYLLPWGQMSFWGAQVIINLFDSIPLIGPDLSTWIRGDFVIGDSTLNRFFAIHTMVMPTVMIGLIVAHVMALHDVGSNNPDGIEIKDHLGDDGKPLDGIPFHPYYTVHDLYGISFFFIIYFAVVFFAPEMGGVFLEGNNFIPANPMQTPLHIAPLWYFTPFYTILRATTSDFLPWIAGAALTLGGLSYFTVRGWRSRLAVAAITALVFAFLTVHKVRLDAKLWGVILMAVSVTILFALPWLDRSPVKSMRYRPVWHRGLLFAFLGAFFVLGYFGMEEPNPMRNLISQFCMAIYFGYFALMPWWSRMGRFKPVPDRVHFVAH